MLKNKNARSPKNVKKLTKKNVNIGAGTITANYDGRKKNRTVIEDGASIGVGAILIAPVKIGRGAVVGAGCVVPKNRDVAKGATVVGVPGRITKQDGKKIDISLDHIHVLDPIMQAIEELEKRIEKLENK